VTDENRRANILTEVNRGAESLESAQILLDAGKHADAVSRAYYAAFHHAQALLLMSGQQARRHGGVERLLHQNLVRPGKLDPKTARSYAHLLKDRLDADYGAATVFTADLATDAVVNARAFCAAARALLVADGWLSDSGDPGP
jgi:uncharacterized protein (UPF0332 family)